MNVETPPSDGPVQSFIPVPKKLWEDQQMRLGMVSARLHQLNFAVTFAAQTASLDRFMALAMAICNNLSVHFKATRVSIGILRGGAIHLVAMSQTEKILRKMRLVRDLEEAMEECFDQDADIFYPAPTAGNVITRCTARLVSCHGDGIVLSLPLRRDGAAAVLLLEFEPGRSVSPTDIASLRAAADLLAPRLLDLHAHDRWLGARMVHDWRSHLATLVGPTHTWIKALAVVVSLFLAWAFFARGTFHIIARFTLEPVRQAQVVAPFDGYIKSVLVRPGDKVVAGKTILARLHTARLRDELAAAQAQFAAYAKQSQVARARGKIADMQIADDSMNGAAAKMRLLRGQIAHAAITSPISGLVLSGHLQRRIGAPVHLGDVLFRVAPIKPLVARLDVLDGDILYVKTGEIGNLATASYPAYRMPLKVLHVNPLAIVKHKRNVFRVRALIHRPPKWLRPGMQGTARINAGRRRYIWIWTRGLINWIRMKLWI